MSVQHPHYVRQTSLKSHHIGTIVDLSTQGAVDNLDAYIQPPKWVAIVSYLYT